MKTRSLTSLPKPEFPEAPAGLDKAALKQWRSRTQNEDKTYNSLVTGMARAFRIDLARPSRALYAGVWSVRPGGDRKREHRRFRSAGSQPPERTYCRGSGQSVRGVWTPVVRGANP